jgi:hypothetical protein
MAKLQLSPASLSGSDLVARFRCRDSYADPAADFADCQAEPVFALAVIPAGSSTVPGSADPYFDFDHPWKQLLCDSVAITGMSRRKTLDVCKSSQIEWLLGWDCGAAEVG